MSLNTDMPFVRDYIVIFLINNESYLVLVHPIFAGDLEVSVRSSVVRIAGDFSFSHNLLEKEKGIESLSLSSSLNSLLGFRLSFLLFYFSFSVRVLSISFSFSIERRSGDQIR